MPHLSPFEFLQLLTAARKSYVEDVSAVKGPSCWHRTEHSLLLLLIFNAFIGVHCNCFNILYTCLFIVVRFLEYSPRLKGEAMNKMDIISENQFPNVVFLLSVSFSLWGNMNFIYLKNHSRVFPWTN